MKSHDGKTIIGRAGLVEPFGSKIEITQTGCLIAARSAIKISRIGKKREQAT